MTAWVSTTFTKEEAEDAPERSLRTAEEALELAQACGVSDEECRRLVDYVFSRPVGEPAKEIAGVLVTVYAMAAALDVDAQAEFEKELVRIQTPEVVERCRRRQHEKRAAMSPSAEVIHRGMLIAKAYNRERDAGLSVSEALDKIAEEFPEVKTNPSLSPTALAALEVEVIRRTPFEGPKKRKSWNP